MVAERIKISNIFIIFKISNKRNKIHIRETNNIIGRLNSVMLIC
jgi:hypothetical protein